MRILPCVLPLLAGSGTLLDVHVGERSGPYVAAEGPLSGFFETGVPARGSLVKLELFHGRSPGSILNAEIWPFARVELGVIGASVGVLFLDAGVGTLLYDPTTWIRPDAPRADEPSTNDPEAPPHEPTSE